MTEAPAIGIISDTSLQRHALSKAVKTEGYQLAVNTTPDKLDRSLLAKPGVDVWLVELQDEELWVDLVDELLEIAVAPVLFGDGGEAPSETSPYYPKWCRRLFAKLRQQIGQPIRLTAKNLQLDDVVSEEPPIRINSDGRVEATHVWTLGASLGGPAAVKKFMDALPPKLPVGFVLAQHIDSGFQHVLAQVLGRNNRYEFKVAEQGHPVLESQVVIAPVETEIGFSPQKRLRFFNRPWRGPYSPSIDQVMQHVADAYGNKGGAIIFSGMGNDGAIAGGYLKEKGAEVWAQTAESCACSSMPDSVRATKCTSFSGTPEQLASQFVSHLKMIGLIN